MIEKKIYSAVDAENLLEGTYGYFGNIVETLRERIKEMDINHLGFLETVFSGETEYRFRQKIGYDYRDFSMYFPVCHKRNFEAYKAWTEGKNVYALKDGEKHWYSPNCGAKPDFLNDEKLYAVDEEAEPEKKYVPFDTLDEFVEASGVEVVKGSRPLIWLRCIDVSPSFERLVIGYRTETDEVFIGFSGYRVEDLLKKFTFLDGSPCGKEAD